MTLACLALGLATALRAAGLDEGLQLMDRQRYREAVVVLEREAKAHPGSAAVLLNLGSAYQRAHRPEDARRCYDVLVRLDPRNPSYLSLLAETEAERGDFATAMRLIERAMRLAPGDKEVALTYARLLVRSRRVKQGGEVIDRLRAQFPDDRAVEFAMADYLSQTGRLEDALNYLDRLVRDDAGNASIRRMRASVLYNLGHIKEAVDEWTALAAQDPPDEGSLLNLGWAAWHDDRLDEAELYGNKLVGLDSENPTYLRFLAHIKIEKLDSAAALDLGRRALKRIPKDRDTRMLVAKALFHLRRDKEAMAILRELGAEYPDDQQVLFQMADFLAALDRPEDALALFNELVDKHPGNVGYRKRRALVNYALGRFDQAVSEWKLLNEKYPLDPEPIDHLVDDAYDRGAFDEAISWIRRLAGARSLDAAAWLKISSLYRQLGRLPQALAAATKSYETDPTFLSARYQEAELLEETRDWPRAREAWSDLLAKNPNSPRSMFALARVAEGEGDLELAVKIVRAVEREYFSEKTCPAYIELYEARLLADLQQYARSMRIVKRAERKSPSVPVLLYQGLSSWERGDSLWKENFRKHMLAVKKAGYHPITTVELEKFLEGDGKLPDKPILITFDGGRMDAFKNADPILEETGLKATMFVTISSASRSSFHASVEDMRRWRGTGRWDIQLNGYRSHDFVPLDSAGHKGHFLANRLWLADQRRLETIDEFEDRVDADYREGIERVKRFFPGTDVGAIAVPFGDYGQADYTNDPRAAGVNIRLLQKRFKMAFVQDQYGYNFIGSKMTELSRLEVSRETTDTQLLRALQLGEPWVKARLLEAQLWMRTGQPRRAIPIYEDVSAHGVDQPELYADWGQALERDGEHYEAQRKLAQALEEDPGNARYQMLLGQARHNSQPKVGLGIDGWHDTTARGFLRGLGRASASAGPVDLEGFAGHGRYTDSATPAIDSNEGGGSLVVHAGSKLDLHGQGVLRRFNSAAPAADNYSAGAALTVWKGLRVDGTGGRDDVETASALLKGRRYNFQQGSLAWDPALNWSLGARYTHLDLNDENRQWDGRFEVLRKLGANFSAGYGLWAADSRFVSPEYWSPRRLYQNLALLGYDQNFGSIIEATGLPRANVKIQYGAGYGFQETKSRFAQSARADLMWRLSDVVFLNGRGEYTMTPIYSLVQFSAGMGLTY